MTTMTRQRNWTEVGDEYVDRLGGRESVEAEIDLLDWQAVPETGSLTVGFMPGAVINEVIRQLELPKVSAVAIGAFEKPGRPDEDGWYPGFYGVEANYGNGRARVYVLDVGTSVTPLLSDFWPKEG